MSKQPAIIPADASADPRIAVIQQFFEAANARRYASFDTLFAPEATFAAPFADSVATVVTGNEVIRDMFVNMVDPLWNPFIFTIDAIYLVADTRTAVLEYRSEGRVVANGQTYRGQYVSILDIRDGLIHRFTEYHNPTAVTTAMGRPL